MLSHQLKEKASSSLLELFLISLLTVVGTVILFFLHEANAFQNLESLISPVSSFNRSAVAENIWFPKQPALAQEAINLTSQAAFFVEINSDQVLFQKNAHQKLKIASLTKIMTAIVALEHHNLADQFTVSEAVTNIEPDKMFLKTGDKLSLEELLDGLFLVSANDAAELIAQNATGDRASFIKEMNDKAMRLGMKDTQLTNPTGLDEDGPLANQQNSSAYDVALMSRYAIKHYPQLIEITSQPEILIPATADHQAYPLSTSIDLVQSYPGVKGFKTGYTDEAGFALVTLAKRGDKRVLGVLLGASDMRGDAKTLLDYCFRKLATK